MTHNLSRVGKGIDNGQIEFFFGDAQMQLMNTFTCTAMQNIKND